MTCRYIEHPDDKTVEIIVDGKVTEDDFDRIVGPMEAFIENHGTIKILEIVEHLGGFELGLVGKGARFDLAHMKDFSHCAVVTDSGWIGPFTRLVAPLLSVDIRVFPRRQESAARVWLKEAD